MVKRRQSTKKENYYFIFWGLLSSSHIICFTDNDRTWTKKVTERHQRRNEEMKEQEYSFNEKEFKFECVCENPISIYTCSVFPSSLSFSFELWLLHEKVVVLFQKLETEDG